MSTYNCHNKAKRLRWVGVVILTILTAGLGIWIFWAAVTSWGV